MRNFKLGCLVIDNVDGFCLFEKWGGHYQDQNGEGENKVECVTK